MNDHHIAAGTANENQNQNQNQEASDGACFVHLNAWDDLRPWVNYRPNEVLVTESLALTAPAVAARLTLSLRLQRDRPPGASAQT